MSISLKRNITSANNNSFSRSTKRQCLNNNVKLCSYKSDNKLGGDDSSSFSSDNDSDATIAAEVNGSKLKFTRFADVVHFAPVDSKLSKAVSQYSDDEEEEEGEDRNINDSDKSSCHQKHHNKFQNNENYIATQTNLNLSDGSFIHKKRAKSTNDILNVNYVSGRGVLNNKRYSVNIAEVVGSIPNNNENFNSFNITNKNFRHGSIPKCDFIARSRCFEYLVGAIDEAWARYCDSTSYDEDVAYGYDNDADANDSNLSTDHTVTTPNSNVYTSDEDDGYKTELSATTTVTEYDSDFQHTNQSKMRTLSMINNTLNQPNKITCQGNRRVSEVPENVRLQQLKDRFTKSKYYLEDLVDSDIFNDCLAFWTKWDLIKYSIVDFVEEDEEDEDIEKKIDELEAGRFGGSLVN